MGERRSALHAEVRKELRAANRLLSERSAVGKTFGLGLEHCQLPECHMAFNQSCACVLLILVRSFHATLD